VPLALIFVFIAVYNSCIIQVWFNFLPIKNLFSLNYVASSDRPCQEQKTY